MKSSITVNNQQFFETILQSINNGQSVCFYAKGRSMSPLICDNKDQVVLSSVTESTIQKGNIVLAHLPTGTYVVHRIEKIEGNTITLRGDGNPYARETCSIADIKAEVTRIVKPNRTITKDSRLWNMAKMWPSHGFVRRVLLKLWRTINGV